MASDHHNINFTEEEWAEVAEGIPKTTDPFIQQYISGRENLIEKEKQTRSDASFRKSLSPIARRACNIVDSIRTHEQQTIWTPDLEEHLAQSTGETIFPGMMFSMAKDRLEGTELWKIVRKMPKGALLHAHLDAMVEFDYLIAELMKLPGMHMSSDQPLHSKEALESAPLTFRYRAKERVEQSPWDEKYEPGTFVLLTKVADEFPKGGREGFLKWLKSRCTLSFQDSIEQHHGIDAIWRTFSKCFRVCDSMIHYEPMFRLFLQRLFSSLMQDGVRWAELR